MRYKGVAGPSENIAYFRKPQVFCLTIALPCQAPHERAPRERSAKALQVKVRGRARALRAAGLRHGGGAAGGVPAARGRGLLT